MAEIINVNRINIVAQKA